MLILFLMLTEIPNTYLCYPVKTNLELRHKKGLPFTGLSFYDRDVIMFRFEKIHFQNNEHMDK